jgi:hypothetical protein
MAWLIEIILLRLLQCCPAVSRSGNVLVARSGWKSQFLCLGSTGRKVTVDTDQKFLRIRYRVFWFLTISKLYTFERILNVVYDYKPIWLISGWYQERGIYTVEIRLTSGERITLFRFFDSGSFSNEGFLPDFIYWQDYMDSALTQSDQGMQADMFAHLLSGILGRRLHTD